MGDQAPRSTTAPFYHIPRQAIVSVEHPAIVQNIDKAIETLQGNRGISRILRPPKADTPANLMLRPEDALARPVQSTSLPASNILLKITVPKRTGRKRKRGSGSDDPFVESGSAAAAALQPPARQRPRARDLLRSLQDNVGRYEVEAVGSIERTHVFRGMPDFVFSTAGSAFTQRIREHILPFDYDKMKEFDLDMSKGATTNADIMPPPSFSHGDLPFGYAYRQNPTVRQSVDTAGKATTANTQEAAKIQTHLVPYDIETVPTKPRDTCPPLDTRDQAIQDTVAALHELFARRPAWTRRGLRNSLQVLEQRQSLRYAIAYVGYIFRSGAWRDAIVKFGHDPRSSPDYRFYQTVMFRVIPRDAEVARDGGGGRRHTIPRPSESDLVGVVDPAAITLDTTGTTTTTTTSGGLILPMVNSGSHLFTGKLPLPRDGRIWMLCDLVDPILAEIVNPRSRPRRDDAKAGPEQGPEPESSPSETMNQFPPPPAPPGFLRSTCEPLTDGWFGSGTLAKVKTIMRVKIQSLLEEREPDDADFRRILTFPDHTDPVGDPGLTAFMLDPASEPGGVTTREALLATEVRAMLRGTAMWRRREKEGRQEFGLGLRAVGTSREEGGEDEGRSDGGGGRAPMGTGAEKVKKVQWREDETGMVEESEGEEEEIEREAMFEEEMETAAAAAARHEQEQSDGDDDDDDGGDDNEEEEDEEDNAEDE